MDYYVGDDYTIRFFEGQEAAAVERDPFTVTLVDDPAPSLEAAFRTFAQSRITVVAEEDDAAYLALAISTPHFEASGETGNLLMSGNTFVVRELVLLSNSDLQTVGAHVIRAVADSASETGYHQVIAEIDPAFADAFTDAGWTVEDAGVGRTWMEQPGIVIVDDGTPHLMVGLSKVPSEGRLIAHRALHPELVAASFLAGEEPEEDAVAALIYAAEQRGGDLPAWFTSELEVWPARG